MATLATLTSYFLLQFTYFLQEQNSCYKTVKMNVFPQSDLICGKRGLSVVQGNTAPWGAGGSKWNVIYMDQLQMDVLVGMEQLCIDVCYLESQIATAMISNLLNRTCPTSLKALICSSAESAQHPMEQGPLTGRRIVVRSNRWYKVDGKYAWNQSAHETSCSPS